MSVHPYISTVIRGLLISHINLAFLYIIIIGKD